MGRADGPATGVAGDWYTGEYSRRGVMPRLRPRPGSLKSSLKGVVARLGRFPSEGWKYQSRGVGVRRGSGVGSGADEGPDDGDGDVPAP
jgi:hypothetical protein